MLNILENYILEKECVSKKRYKDNIEYYVNNKLFALLEVNNKSLTIHVKNKPIYNYYLRNDNYKVSASTVNKYHWNSIYIENKKDLGFVFYMIDISYKLSIEKMTKKEKLFYNYCLSCEVS